MPTSDIDEGDSRASLLVFTTALPSAGLAGSPDVGIAQRRSDICVSTGLKQTHLRRFQRQMTMYLVDGARLRRWAYDLDRGSKRNCRLYDSLTLR